MAREYWSTIEAVAKRTSAPTRPTVLRGSGLRRAYGPNTILDNFSLEVRAGEAVALTGPNGSGESSPCRRPSTEIQREMATVIADLDFFPGLSVVEHLDLQTRANQASSSAGSRRSGSGGRPHWPRPIGGCGEWLLGGELDLVPAGRAAGENPAPLVGLGGAGQVGGPDLGAVSPGWPVVAERPLPPQVDAAVRG